VLYILSVYLRNKEKPVRYTDEITKVKTVSPRKREGLSKV